MADYEGQVSIVYTPDGGEPVLITVRTLDTSVWARTGPLDLNQQLPNGKGTSRRQKYVDAVITEIENMDRLISGFLRIKTFDRLSEYDPEEEITWDEEIVIDQNSVNEEVNWTRLTGRYFVVELEDTFPSGQWKWSGLEFYGKLMKGRM